MPLLCNFEGYNCVVILPINFKKEDTYKLLILNDGDILENKVSLSFDGIILGIIPKNRLNEYTPWKEQAIRQGAPDFGGNAKEYNDYLENKILPSFMKEYSIDRNYIIYGGYSLGGLCAIYSLYHNKIFTHIFSVCGSFWYPSFDDYAFNEKVVNKKAKLYLLNGLNEGRNHGNILEPAPIKAKKIHEILAKSNEAISIFDEYGHHEQMNERLNKVINLIK